eukprot:6028107-Prymnesium_polylepis.2
MTPDLTAVTVSAERTYRPTATHVQGLPFLFENVKCKTLHTNPARRGASGESDREVSFALISATSLIGPPPRSRVPCVPRRVTESERSNVVTADA